jgi:tRNA threonylcarbamoyladenosine biosynthesis protein TsaB
MKILAIDSSSRNISLSIMQADKILIDFNKRMDFGSSKIISYIDSYLKKLSLSIEEFDVFTVGSGPGSFTGLRISFSIVKAFSLALNKPIISIESFFSIAYPFRHKQKRIAVISDARRNLIYAATFSTHNGILRKEAKERLTSIEDFLKQKKEYFFITPDENILKSILNKYPQLEVYPKQVYPNARFLLELAKEYYIKKRFTSLDKLEPLYLHPKTCQIRGQMTEVRGQRAEGRRERGEG